MCSSDAGSRHDSELEKGYCKCIVRVDTLLWKLIVYQYITSVSCVFVRFYCDESFRSRFLRRL